MAVCSKNFHIDFTIKNTIYHPMFLVKLTAPPAFRLPFQRFRMTKSCFGMYGKFLQQAVSFGENLGSLFASFA